MDNRLDAILNRSAPRRTSQHDGGTSAPDSASNTSASNTSATTPPSAGNSGHEVRFSPSAIKKLGRDIERELDAIFTQARYSLNGTPRDLETAAFTTFGYACAMAHTEVIEFTDLDLITKSKQAMEFDDLLQKTAANQNEAERKSTVNGDD
jgi:hypothetical protein